MEKVLFCAALYAFICSCQSSTVAPISEFTLFDDEFYNIQDNNVEKSACPTLDPDIAEDAKLDPSQLIKKYGYEAETHYVTTEDNYILQLHRITGGKKYPPRSGKKVVYLQHGLMDTSASWVMTRPGKGLGFILADADYDVWMGNARGNTYSRNHTTLKPFGSASERKRFWSFSWHEIGVYDLPAAIDYVLLKTNESRLQYIGLSQGTTVFFVMCAQKPEYNSKIQIMHALAPIGYLSHVKSPLLRVIVPFISKFQIVDSLLRVYRFTPSNKILKFTCENQCRFGLKNICKNFLFSLSGFSPDQFNTTLLPVLVGHFGGGSTMQMWHYIQEIKSKRFRQYDYGFIENRKRYRHISPPDYNLTNIRAPVAVYNSQNDWLANVKDVKALVNKLPNVVENYLVPHKTFNHIDFIWGIDAPRLLYDQVLKVMATGNRDKINDN